MTKISFEKSSGNVFTDIGFTPAEAAASLARFSSLRGLLHFAGARAGARACRCRDYPATLPRHDKRGVNAQYCTRPKPECSETQTGPNKQKYLGLPMPQFCFFNREPNPPASEIAQPPIPAGSESRLRKLASWD